MGWWRNSRHGSVLSLVEVVLCTVYSWREKPMPLSEKLVEILRCPKCKGDLDREANEAGFVCQACSLRFPVVDGIPNFLVSEAQPVNQKNQTD
jgi:uncharacterized protein YbaR (Trm112 family)